MINSVDSNLRGTLDFSGYLAAEAEPAAVKDETSIFQSAVLESGLEQVKNNNGFFTGLWDSFKISMGTGSNSRKCEDAVNAYRRGEIDFEEADKRIKEYSKKQDGSLNLFSNIAASIAALGVTAAAAASIAATGGAASPFVLAAIAGGTGALTKAGFKLADRASNNIDNDALDLKQIAKDSLSGAVTGSIAAVTMGTAASAETIGSAAVNCALTGVKTGALSGGANYVIDCTLDGDRDFSVSDFALTTLESAAVGGAVGAVMGGANASMHRAGILKSGCGFKKFIETNGASTRDFIANSVCTTEYKLMNAGIRNSYS